MKKNLLFKTLLILIGVLIMSVPQVRADITFTGGYVYFDNTNTEFDDGVIELVAHQWTGSKDHIGCTTMGLISGTNNLYYIKDPNGSNWGGIWGWRIMSNGSAWGSGDNTDSSVQTYSGNCTGTSTTGLSSGYSYLCYGASSTKNSTFTVSSLGNSATQYNSLNYTQTLYQCVAENGGTPAKSTASIGTISITTKKLNGRSTTTDSNGSISSGQNKVEKDAARTATVTMTVSSIDGDYAWVGWYDAESGGNLLEDDETYTYQATAATTVYARFSHERNNSVTISRYCTSTSSQISSTSQNIGEVTYASISAPDIDGYNFVNWSLGSGLSKHSSDELTSNPIRVITLSSGTYTLTANYTEDLTSTWHIIGEPNTVIPNGWTANDDNMLRKASGSSTGSVGSLTINVKTLPSDDDDYQFKVYESEGNTPYGWSNTNYYYMNRGATKTTGVYSADSHPLYFIPDALGDYTFAVDWSGSDPSLTVTFPATTYTVNFGQGTGTAGTASATYSSTSFNSGTKVQNGKSISLSAPAAISGKYNWDGWYNASSGGSKVSSDNPFVTTVSSSNHDFYARYSEIKHTVTLANDGHGHVEISSSTVTSVTGVGCATTSGTITAVADPGYYFVNWTGDINNGVTIASGSTSTASITINATADSKTITANFAPIWRVACSSDSHDTESHQITTITASEGVMISGSVTIDLNANTDYDLKIFNKPNNKWWGHSGDVTEITYTNKATAQSLAENTGSNQTFHTAGKGTYTFTWDVTNSKISIGYPTSYTVTFGEGTGNGTAVTASVESSGAITSGQYAAAGKDITFSQAAHEGYTFAGWYTASSGGTTVTGMSTSDHVYDDIATDISVYAQYTANEWTVSFDATANGGSCATASKPVTYDAAYGTLPVATHGSQEFVGWYTSASGPGTRVTAETIVSTDGNHTLYARFESIYSVNVDFKCGDAKVYPSTSVEASPTSLTPTITAPEIFGYTFVNWTGTNVTLAEPGSATTTITATAATTITANYNVVPTVYFKNNLGWDSVFVSFDITWTSVDGKQVPNNSGKPYFAMTQIGSSDVYYCEIPDTYTATNYASWSANIAFDNKNYNYKATADVHTGNMTSFYQGEFTGRGDFDPKATLFIPYNGDTEARNSGTFYQSGCWMKYNSTESGYQVNMNTLVTGTNDDTLTVKLTAANAGGYEFSAKLNLTHPNYTYGFKLYKDYQKSSNDIWYTNCPATIGAATDDLPWPFWAGTSVTATSDRCGLHTESLGDYTITVSFATGKPMVNVEYPTLVGDWRLAYNDRVAWSGGTHDASWHLYSRVIKAKANAEDIVSFYVSKADGASASIELQKCTAINASTGAETWTKQSDVLLTSITKTGFYNFTVTQDEDKEASVAYLGSYDGNFYIRTDASDGGWSNYKSSGKNLMTYSEYAEANSGFTHYFMRFVSRGSNIKFCVANDYSDCLTEYCISDSYTNEYIEADGNVRFMWDQRTNAVSRAYISGSSIVSDRFLVLEGDDKMFDELERALTEAGGGKISGLNDYEMKFIDDQNWIYEATVKAQPKAKVKLTAKYNNKIQYFYGGSGSTSKDSVLLLDGTGTDKYKMRIVYDFKTNRLIKAFIPDGDITTALAIDADMMIIREHQGDAQQITFNGGSLSKVKTVYGAMKFNKYTLNKKEKTGSHATTSDSKYKRDLFWISFPFDVKLNEAFGFGTYGTHWIIEYYDGKGRAANGYWADSESNWKFVTPAMRRTFKMNAFEGYILALDLDELTESSSVWDNDVDSVYIYFPSDGEVENIQATNRLVTIDQTGYQCTIGPRFENGDDRRVKDSYWHCIGVPSFANYSRDLTVTNGGATIDWSSTSMPYLYEWQSSDNSLSITSSATFSFKATYSYIVQYSGASIYWSQANTPVPSSVAARMTDTPDREYKLVLQSEERTEDQTFVRMTDDANVTTGFEFNYDLSKEMNKNRANIYTLISTTIDSIPSITEAAANVQPHPLTTTVVPVGVKIAANGEYTFSMPEGTNGGDVWLIDNANSSRTNLGLMDYTVNLTTGTYEGRFSLEFPVQNVVTDLNNDGMMRSDELNDANDVRKVFVGGRLYILRDGKAYDATGAQVR